VTELSFFGPYTLRPLTVYLRAPASPGIYFLGEATRDGFEVSYVGRSDSDLAARLSRHVGKHPAFRFAPTATARDAFLAECAYFHRFGGRATLENLVHPARPMGTTWSCPICLRRRPTSLLGASA
jgi:hypothetical protein